MTTVTDRVSASLHDCFDTTDGGFPGFLDTSSLWWGVGLSSVPRYYYNGIIWDGVSIPGGATINTGCYHDLTDVSFGSGTSYTWGVYGLKEKTLTVWTTGDAPPDREGSTGTSASASWTENFGSGATANSPELNTVIQEIMDIDGSDITDLTLFDKSDVDTAAADRDMESYDTTSAEAPFLTIIYTAAASLGADEMMAARQVSGLQPVQIPTAVVGY